MNKLELLSAAECARVRGDLERLSSEWRFIRPGLSILGTPWWLSGPLWRENLKKTNPLLKEHFGWLLERVRAALEGHLQKRTVLSDGFSYPGFHIFQSVDGTDPTGDPASIHWDYRTFSEMDVWDPPLDKFMDRAETLSFTLAIKLPACGSGLCVWPNASGFEVERLRERYDVHEHVAVLYLAARERREYERYVEGSMVVHDGQILHWIPPFDSVQRGDERITLQGHGFLRGDHWQLFW